MSRDPRVDAYINAAASFAQPILTHLRALVWQACPTVAEDIKWGFAHFLHRDAMVCSMAAFQRHCAFGFWLGERVLDNAAQPAMGQLGRLSSVDDLPTDAVLLRHLRKALALNEAGVRRARPSSPPGPPPSLPADVAARWQCVPAAWTHYHRLSPSGQREYLDWLDQAKTAATRERRLATATAWLAEGKSRHWKYQR